MWFPTCISRKALPWPHAVTDCYHYDTMETLNRIERLFAAVHARRLICLGDSFHDMNAAERLSDKEMARLKAISAAQDTIWIEGNHDPHPPAEVGAPSRARLRSALWSSGTCRQMGGGHRARSPAICTQRPVSAGAGAVFLPAVSRLTGRGPSCRPSAPTPVVWMLPTGAFRGLFLGGFHAWMMLPEKVYAVHASKLARRSESPSLNGRIVADEGQEGQPSDVPRIGRKPARRSAERPGNSRSHTTRSRVPA